MIGNVATLTMAGGPAEIDRYDRLRNINFEIELNGSRSAKSKSWRWPCPA
jgi:multidrug efflux pump subunit AcrB